VPEPGNPQGLNRYSYTLNNPLKYTDPSGHFAWFVAVPVGALIGAGVTYGFQVAANISQNGLNVQAFTEVNWAAVGGGAVAGAVGVATFGVGTAVMGTGLGATVAAGAISGAVSGQAARATENVLSGQEVTAGLGNPADIATEAVVGGALAGVGYGIGRLARPANEIRTINTTWSIMGRNRAGGIFYGSNDIIDARDVSEIVENLANGGNRVSVLSGAHGGPLGEMRPEWKFYIEDLPLAQKFPNVSVYNVYLTSKNVIENLEGSVVCAWCWSANSTYIHRMIVK
jgi:hypothetical protein